MIVSVSRRTDIPAFYGQWFVNRLRAGYCLVPNPFNLHQVARVSLLREDVDAFVFWTRNPRPFVPALDELDRRGDPYVVLFTLTGYGPPLEFGAPDPVSAVGAFRELSLRVGAERVRWRYDPVVFGPGLGPRDHVRRFSRLASRLEGATTTVVTSLLDLYRKTRRRLGEVAREHVLDPADDPRAGEMVAALVERARRHGMDLVTCAEERDFSRFGARPGACIDADQLARLFGVSVHGSDPGQRTCCRCAPSRDIGMTDTCLHECAYCYATRSHEAARRRHAAHDPEGESLVPLQSSGGRRA
jgi:hypothetical protein